jgi:hypothetical protein
VQVPWRLPVNLGAVMTFPLLSFVNSLARGLKARWRGQGFA